MARYLSRAELSCIAGKYIEMYYALFGISKNDPAPINPEQFANSVLGLNLKMLPLCSDGHILGLTVFQRCSFTATLEDGTKLVEVFMPRDVYMMDLNPYSGSEQGGIRPAIVVQNDDGNFYSNVLLVVPLTTQIKKRNMPTHFILHNRFLSAPSMAICESPRPADKSRVLSYLGHLSKYEMRQVSVCLQYSFGFIGYKSFRKYLTAPPQEDVLAAAKELLSQQFQNLRVLNSQPPALAKHTKGDLHSIEQISERMLSTPTESSVEFMVAELDDALQSLMFRWNICYERYSAFRLSDNEKKKIGSIIQSGIDFLQKKKEVPL